MLPAIVRGDLKMYSELKLYRFYVEELKIKRLFEEYATTLN